MGCRKNTTTNIGSPTFPKIFFSLKTNNLKTYPILFFKLIVKIFPAFYTIPLNFPGNVLYLCGGNNRYFLSSKSDMKQKKAT